jgi:hypothetical protein
MCYLRDWSVIPGFRVTRTLHRDLRGGALDVAEIVRPELDGNCADILVQARERLRVPGMGTIQGFWASNQASTIWVGVALPLRDAAEQIDQAWFTF